MKTQEFNTPVSRIAIQAGIKKEGRAASYVQIESDREEKCPFTLESIADCRIRNTDDQGGICPFSLEDCLQPNN
jgi:hypothetical protein